MLYDMAYNSIIDEANPHIYVSLNKYKNIFCCLCNTADRNKCLQIDYLNLTTEATFSTLKNDIFERDFTRVRLSLWFFSIVFLFQFRLSTLICSTMIRRFNLKNEQNLLVCMAITCLLNIIFEI